MNNLNILCDRCPILNLAVQELCLQGSGHLDDEQRESLDRTMRVLEQMAQERILSEGPASSDQADIIKPAR